MIDGIKPPRRPAPAPGNGMRSPDRDFLNKFAGSTQSKLPNVEPYRTPQSMAAGQGTPQGNMPASAPTPSSPETNDNWQGEGDVPPRQQKVPGESFMDKLRNLDKKQWAIIIAVIILVIGGGVFAYFKFFQKEKAVGPAATQQRQQETETTPAPTTVASKLSGLQVEPAVNERPVTGIMIENSTDARPQSGMQEADVVFEAVAEGGITRFLALYQDKTTPYIGPVRSVRPYYIQWAMGFDAAIAHAGGSAEALNNIKQWKTKDLDQFANGGAYKRISGRYAPHNLYTSIDALNQLESKKGFGTANFTGFARKADEASKTPSATSIDVKISSQYFNSHYDYDPGSNSYKRSQAGAPHMMVSEDGKVQTQLQPKVVIALVMTQGRAGDVHTAYGTIGSGTAYIFQDGKLTEGTWKKGGNSEQFTFTNLSGEPVKLNAGQTWLTAVGSTSLVTYK